MAHLMLASASPRRRELLEQIGVNFICEAQDLDESIKQDESPAAYVERLAREKALQGFQHANIPVLGADTCVVLEGEILGKPSTTAHANAMLKALAGKSHNVLTAIALCVEQAGEASVHSLVVSTEVNFTALSDEQIASYVKTGEPMDKAGSYGIQGKAAVFVAGIVGSYSNVVGLPLKETADLLQQHQVPIWCN